MNLPYSRRPARRLKCLTLAAVAWLGLSVLRRKSTRYRKHSASACCFRLCEMQPLILWLSQTVSAVANKLLRTPTGAPCTLPRSSVVSLDNILKWLAIGKTLHLLRNQVKGPRHVERARSADVRREQQVRRAPQRMAGRQRFRICDIERRTNAFFGESLHQSVGFDDWSSCSVDQQRALFHARDCSCVDQVMRFRRKRHDQHNNISRRQ